MGLCKICVNPKGMAHPVINEQGATPEHHVLRVFEQCVRQATDRITQGKQSVPERTAYAQHSFDPSYYICQQASHTLLPYMVALCIASTVCCAVHIDLEQPTREAVKYTSTALPLSSWNCNTVQYKSDMGCGIQQCCTCAARDAPPACPAHRQHSLHSVHTAQRLHLGCN